MEGPLKNPRHEKFANAMSQGASATKAYIIAGFSTAGAAVGANRLLKDPKISVRVEYLRSLASREATAKCALDREWVLANLKEIIMDKKEPTASRVRSLELCGKHIGMFIDLSETKLSWDGDPTKLSAAQLQTLIMHLESSGWGGDLEAAKAAKEAHLAEIEKQVVQ